MELFNVTDGRFDYKMLREQLRQADREEQWSLKTGYNRMCYACKRPCKTRNKTWTGCVKREVINQ